MPSRHRRQLGIIPSRHIIVYYADMAKEPYPSETADRFIVRFPDGMRDRIRAEADANGRSMNAEIIHRLAITLEMDDYVPKLNAQTETPAEADRRTMIELIINQNDQIKDLQQTLKRQAEQLDQLLGIKIK